MSDASQLAAEQSLRQEWQAKIQQINTLTDLTDLLVDFRKNSRPPKYRGGDFRWIEAKIEERLAKLKGEQWEPSELMTKTTRGESLTSLKESYIQQINGTRDFKELEQIVDDFREDYRPPIMPVDEFLTIERELCEVLTKVRGERWWEMSEEELRTYRGARVVKEKNEQPHTLMVLYPLPPDVNAFEKVFLDEHSPLARQLPAKMIQTERVKGTVTGDRAPYHRIAELHFDDLQSLQQCAQTQEAKAALEHAVKISTGGKPQFLILESDLAMDEMPGKQRPPVRFIICFPQPEDTNAFETAYFTKILPETLKLPARQFKGYKVVATADETEVPWHRMLMFCFDNETDLTNALASANGKTFLNVLLQASSSPVLIAVDE